MQLLLYEERKWLGAIFLLIYSQSFTSPLFFSETWLLAYTMSSDMSTATYLAVLG